MTVPRSLVFVAVILAASIAVLSIAGPAVAQPLILPGARAPEPAEFLPGPAAPVPGVPRSRRLDGPPAPPASTKPRPPRTPRPVAAKPVSEESVLNRELKLNGVGGRLRLERVGRSAEVRVLATLQGTASAKPGEACEVAIESGAPVPAAPQGKPDGLPRYELKAQSCPISFDILDGAVWINGPAEGCHDEANLCRADPRGLWGPEPGALLAQARTIEQARGQADKVVRENYRTMTQRASPGEVRPIVTEQAAFSSEREQQCRDYAREAGHGFCHARFTEARAALLATKLGTTASIATSASSATPASPAAPAPKKRRKPQVSRRAAPPPIPAWPAFESGPNGIQ